MAARRKTGESEVRDPHIPRRRAATKDSASWKRKNMLMDQRKLERALPAYACAGRESNGRGSVR
jgi:hypothetical protein